MKSFFKTNFFKAAVPIVFAAFILFVAIYIINKENSPTKITNGATYSAVPKNESSHANDFLSSRAKTIILDVKSAKTDKNELAFSFTADDFINSYNGFYYSDNVKNYLRPISDWMKYSRDNSPHSKYETLFYLFSENGKVWPYPTITICTQANSSIASEVMVSLDTHAYSNDMYEVFKEMSYYSLKVFLPSMEQSKIEDLFEKLYKLSYKNYVETPYGYDPTPPAIYVSGETGIYPYYAEGEPLNICIIPVDNEYIEKLKEKGVSVYNLEE